DMPDDAGAPLVSGHPPNAPASRTPLQNRVAIVTGGTGALGQAVTLRFLADGAIVAVPYAVETERAELRARVTPAQRDRLVTEPVDVTDLAAMTAFVERTIVARGRVDVLGGAVRGFAGAVLPGTGRASWAPMPDSDRRGWVPVEAVADAIALLAREESAYITGTLLAI